MPCCPMPSIWREEEAEERKCHGRGGERDRGMCCQEEKKAREAPGQFFPGRLGYRDGFPHARMRFSERTEGRSLWDCLGSPEPEVGGGRSGKVSGKQTREA